jgi:hypothetical protein
VIAGLALIGVYLSGTNLMNAAHDPYTNIPFPPLSVNRLLSSQPPGVTDMRTEEQLAAAGGPTLARYLLELSAHGDESHRTLLADYQRERWYALISPIHAVWEIAQQLLQDRHNVSTELLAPLAAMDPPPPIRQSLREALPEIVGLLGIWLVLFAINSRVLARLEV